jgi:hypothetical protein
MCKEGQQTLELWPAVIFPSRPRFSGFKLRECSGHWPQALYAQGSQCTSCADVRKIGHRSEFIGYIRKSSAGEL